MNIEREFSKPKPQGDGSYKIVVVSKVDGVGKGCPVVYKNDGPEGPLTSANLEAVSTRLMTVKPVISKAVREEKDGDDNVTVAAQAEVLGLSGNEKMAKYFRDRLVQEEALSDEVALPQVEEEYEAEEAYTDDDGHQQTRLVTRKRMVDKATMADITVAD